MFSGTGGNAYVGATSQDLQEAQANQQFWNQVYGQFNPEAQAITSAPATPAYQNVAQNAQSMFANKQPGGLTGNVDQNLVGQNLQNKGESQARTQDINNFLSDTSQNQKTAEQRELSMFGGSQNQNAQNQSLFQGAPEKAILSNAQTQTQEANEWNDYNTNQPNWFNEVAGAAGGALGKVTGSAASNSLFGNNGQDKEDEEE